MVSPWDFVLPILLSAPPGDGYSLFPLSRSINSYLQSVQRPRHDYWCCRVEEFYPEVAQGSSEVSSLRDEEDTPFLPPVVILSHAQIISCSQPSSPASIRMSNTAEKWSNRSLSSSPELSLLLFLFVLPPSYLRRFMNMKYLPCALQWIRGAENVADCEDLIFNQVILFSPFKAEAQ